MDPGQVTREDQKKVCAQMWRSYFGFGVLWFLGNIISRNRQ